jgi:hypothetical protein
MCQGFEAFVFSHSLMHVCPPFLISLNPWLQIPIFVVLGLTLRMMGRAKWPGFASEGALGFPDLTQQVRCSCRGEWEGWGLLLGRVPHHASPE